MRILEEVEGKEEKMERGREGGEERKRGRKRNIDVSHIDWLRPVHVQTGAESQTCNPVTCL